MTSPTSLDAPLLLKKDACGRIMMPADRREAILDEFERSGMSGAAFARHYGLKYQTFMEWHAKRKRRVASGTESRQALALAEVVVHGASRPSPEIEPGLRIALPGGATMHVCRPEDGVLAASILQALGDRGARC
jgi:hypothetical protein